MQLQPRFDQSRQETITVPKGHVWVEGDNPTLSVDSRQIGAVPAALVLGRACAIVSGEKTSSCSFGVARAYCGEHVLLELFGANNLLCVHVLCAARRGHSTELL